MRRHFYEEKKPLCVNEKTFTYVKKTLPETLNPEREDILGEKKHICPEKKKKRKKKKKKKTMAFKARPLTRSRNKKE